MPLDLHVDRAAADPRPLLENREQHTPKSGQARCVPRCSPPVTTLTGEIVAYVNGRLARGEIKRNTASDLRWTLAGFARSFGHRPLDQLGPRAVDRWLESVGTLSDATRREYLSRVRGFTQWLVSEGKVRSDPTAHVPAIRQARRAPRTLDAGQVDALLQTVPDRRAMAIVMLMVGCGCRCAEVTRLQVEDYDRRTITVRGKSDHERTIPVPAMVARAIDGYLEETGVVAGPLIRSQLRPSHGISPRTLSQYVRRWMREAKVKTRALDGRSAHALRRTAASDVMDASGDVRVVQAMLGHQRLETTARSYLRPVSMEAMRDAMEGRAYVS